MIHTMFNLFNVPQTAAARRMNGIVNSFANNANWNAAERDKKK